ncbi:MAG: hypothetical protein AAGC72_17755, partial [Planctomycetota bacterium]
MKLTHLSLAMFALILLTLPTLGQRMPKEDVIEVPAIGEGLCVSNVFQANMVLQRDKPLAVWGWGEPGKQVSVSFSGERATATVGNDRAWRVQLPAQGVNTDPQTMTISSGGETLRLENILVGDVWVLGGQSNMEFELAKVENGKLEIISANYPNLRILTVPSAEGPELAAGFPRLHEWSGWSNRHFRKGDWDVCTPEIARDLSAIGFVFARRVHMASGVPIGVIDTSRGGTTVEGWTPRDAMVGMDQPFTNAVLAEWGRSGLHPPDHLRAWSDLIRWLSQGLRLKRRTGRLLASAQMN